MEKKITENTTLAEILKRGPDKGRGGRRVGWSPEAEKILTKYNLPCLWCPMAKFEIENLKIGEVCKMYGINLRDLLRELNEKIKK